MKVKCIDTNQQAGHLTLEKEYTVTETFPGNEEYRITDDKGISLRYDSYHFERVEEFKKSDLKSGMVVEIRQELYLLLQVNNEMLFVCQGNGYLPFSRYSEDLDNRLFEDEWDIKKVYSSDLTRGLKYAFDSDNLTLLWEKELPKEMTIEEVEKELGYSIKIVTKKEDYDK